MPMSNKTIIIFTYKYIASPFFIGMDLFGEIKNV